MREIGILRDIGIFGERIASEFHASKQKSSELLIFIIGPPFCNQATLCSNHHIIAMQNTTPISKIMTRKPSTVTPEDSLEIVRTIFEKHGFHHVPVIEQNKLVGIVSYTDYLRIISELYGNQQKQVTSERLLQNVLVKEVMTEHLVCLSPTDTVEDALRIFKPNHFHAIPVIEGDRHLVGILSTHDLIKVLERVLAPEIDYASK